MLETIQSLKEDLESIKSNNEKLLKAKVDQEEINNILLKSFIEKKQNKQIGQTTSHNGQGSLKEEPHKRKELETINEDSELEESLDKEYNTLTSDSSSSKGLELKIKNNKGFGIELYGEFKNI